MTVKEFANKFGMNINELSVYTGYSRKSLYNIFGSRSQANRHRFEIMIKSLRAKAKLEWEEEGSKARDTYLIRCQILEDLEEDLRKVV